MRENMTNICVRKCYEKTVTSSVRNFMKNFYFYRGCKRLGCLPDHDIFVAVPITNWPEDVVCKNVCRVDSRIKMIERFNPNRTLKECFPRRKKMSIIDGGRNGWSIPKLIIVFFGWSSKHDCVFFSSKKFPHCQQTSKSTTARKILSTKRLTKSLSVLNHRPKFLSSRSVGGILARVNAKTEVLKGWKVSR